MTGEPDKRATARVQPFVVRCLIVDGARRLAAYLTDLSATGAQVTVEGEPPAAGASVVVEVRLGREAAARRLPATVQWARDEDPPPPPSFGVVFRIGEDDRRAIEAVLADVRRRASQISRGARVLPAGPILKPRSRRSRTPGAWTKTLLRRSKAAKTSMLRGPPRQRAPPSKLRSVKLPRGNRGTGSAVTRRTSAAA